MTDFPAGLIYAAVRNQFQGASFAGLIGLSMTAVSRQTYFNNRPPLFDALVSSGVVEKPVFSISLPRLGDPDSEPVGKLTLGGIEPEYAGLNITYSDIINSTKYVNVPPKCTDVWENSNLREPVTTTMTFRSRHKAGRSSCKGCA